MTTRILPSLLVVGGVALLANVAVPIGWSQLRFSLRPKLLDPTAVAWAPAPLVVDLSHPANWFTGLPPAPAGKLASKIGYYTLTIASLGLESVPVEIGGDNLKQNAIQYPGTALPGTWGNSVIFGHSSLPQLFRPQEPLTIFNPLPKIQRGDEVVINHDGVTYRYKVRETAEVAPSQIEILAQRYDKRQLTLVTCVPLGTYLRRFVARAELVN